jgi:hypothetical protein
MKRLFSALVSLFVLSGLAVATVPMGVCHKGMALDRYGHPAGGAQVQVCSVPYGGSGLCNPTVNIFYDVGLTQPLLNPFPADMQGNYRWCSTGGTHYVEQVSFVNQISTNPDLMLPVTKEYVDANGGTQLLGQPNTWAQTQTFTDAPQVPTPQNPNDAANKSYVDASSANLSSPNPIGNVTPNTVAATALTYQTVTGVQYLVSKYASIQAAINAAEGSGQVTGVVVDDRTSNYTGAGFNIPDSVTVQLAPAIYTINATVTFNNGNNNVTAGIIVQPGARLLGSSTSTNHGTIIQPANGLNADLIATSTEGTGTTTPQWWHWGEIGNLRLIGNGANQTAGDCLKIENMGETARIHDIELSACYSHNLENIGYAATQSAISNITSNRSVNGAGVAFTNLSGVALINGVSGDCNQVALISSNFNAAGTLTLHGLKSEAESSICPAQVQDPVILSTTTDSTVLASIKVDGGYAFGTSQHNFVKSTGPGTIQYQQENLYLLGYTNILDDTVRGQVIANVSTATKQPVFYLSNGVVFGNQAFTFQPNTFMQGNPNGTPTEMLGAGSDSSTDIAAIGNGDNTKYFTGGLKFGTFNRTQFGQTPEYQARMGWRWTNPGYDTTTWTFIPIWATGDTSVRWIGDPNVRWPEVYAADVNTTTEEATTATVGTMNSTTENVGTLNATTGTVGTLNSTTATINTLNVTHCTGCGSSGGGFSVTNNEGIAGYQPFVEINGTNSGVGTGYFADDTTTVETTGTGVFRILHPFMDSGVGNSPIGLHGYFPSMPIGGTLVKWTVSGFVPLTSSDAATPAYIIVTNGYGESGWITMMGGDVALIGAALCASDGSTPHVGDYVTANLLSSECHDAGTSVPAGTFIIGILDSYGSSGWVVTLQNIPGVQYSQVGGTVPASHVLSGSMQGPTSAVTGTGSATNLYSYAIPAGTFSVGMGVKCFARLRHTTGSATSTVYWKLGSTTYTYPTNFTTGNLGGDASIEIFTFSALSSQTVNLPWATFGGNTQSPTTGLSWSENLANADTIYLQFSVANTDKFTGDSFWCSTIQ